MPKRETPKPRGTSRKKGQPAKGAAGTKRKPARGKATTQMKSATPASRPAKPRQPETAASLTHEKIAERAWAIWEQHGRPQGEDERNWREAERQLREELGIKQD